MQYRSLGSTGIEVSAVAFGAGPISTLMVGNDYARQRQVIEHAISCGINWFDTAATYGDGQSERCLGQTLDELGAANQVHVATKARLMPTDLDDIHGAIWRSFEDSLKRLRVPRITLLQLHNSITLQRGDEPTSITPDDVLGPGGVLEVFRKLQADGLVSHLGLTGIGHPTALRTVIRSGAFATLQTPYHLLNPSAGRDLNGDFRETNYGNVIADCAAEQMGVFAIRVLAGGALVDNPPSPHTYKTPFFPLALYQRDRLRANRLRTLLGEGRSLSVEAVRFAIDHSHVSSALIGFAETSQIDEACQAIASREPRPDWDAISQLDDDQDQLLMGNGHRMAHDPMLE
jgi:aryl-alcohol dehydrogenase-like predicted oxidoreductase